MISIILPITHQACSAPSCPVPAAFPVAGLPEIRYKGRSVGHSFFSPVRRQSESNPVTIRILYPFSAYVLSAFLLLPVLALFAAGMESFDGGSRDAVIRLPDEVKFDQS